jgi:hypothetical protein
MHSSLQETFDKVATLIRETPVTADLDTVRGLQRASFVFMDSTSTSQQAHAGGRLSLCSALDLVLQVPSLVEM